MNTAPKDGPFERFGRKVDEHFYAPGARSTERITENIADEVRRVITYLNDEVVPQVRRNSSSALRTAAEQLSRLAEHLETNTAQNAGPGGAASKEP